MNFTHKQFSLCFAAALAKSGLRISIGLPPSLHDAKIASQGRGALCSIKVRDSGQVYIPLRLMGSKMQIREMSRQEAWSILGAAFLGRLACAHDGQPYVVPVHFALDGDSLFAFSTVGQKIRWMRDNPRVCLEFEHLAGAQDWATVLIDGVFEELPETEEFEAVRQRAYDLLQRRPNWWEPGYVRTVLRDGERPLYPLFFCIQIKAISGRAGVPEKYMSQDLAHKRRPFWRRLFPTS